MSHFRQIRLRLRGHKAVRGSKNARCSWRAGQRREAQAMGER
jgi:hypothetical protein